MRKINQIFIHCADTKAAHNVTVEEITKWHEERGFRTIGYHWVIYRDGSIHQGRPEDVVGAHVAGKNSNSIGICLAGGKGNNGKAEANYTDVQWKALKEKVIELKKKYLGAEILGHRDAPAAKDCPCFDVRAWLKKEGL